MSTLTERPKENSFTGASSLFCGLYTPTSSAEKRQKTEPPIKKSTLPTLGPYISNSLERVRNAGNKTPGPAFDWARRDQLSIIFEKLESGTTSPTKDISEIAALGTKSRSVDFDFNFDRRKSKGKELDLVVEEYSPKSKAIIPLFALERRGKMEGSGSSSSPKTPRPIPSFQPPPRDLESIARIDASLVFEHFTTEDAWLLGSSLRERLFPHPIPVVINISLANANQTLFHTCTHSGTMPDNESWVARKRKTVLRWGVSTWYMHCKFSGDEKAFADKYGLGNDAGLYAIHGGGVPIRVTGVEGVVAVVVVSGLKQDEDHAVVVETIKELYY